MEAGPPNTDPERQNTEPDPGREPPSPDLAAPTTADKRHGQLVRILVAALAFALAIAAFDAGVLVADSGRRGTGASDLQTASLAPGPVTPDIAGTDLRGRRVSVRSFAGRPLLVAFFGSWCGPCHRQAPTITSIASRFGGRISVLGVAINDSASDDRTFAAKYGWVWPIVEDPDFRWVVAFGAFGLPSTYVLDARGRVVDRVFGTLPRARLIGDLSRLLSA